jgi:outer membrane lipoprotein SlyB
MQQVIRTAPRLHPLTAAAAVSVIVLSVAGVGVIAGVIPTSHGMPPAAAPVVTIPTSTLAPGPVTTPVPAAQEPVATEAPAPVAKPRNSATVHAARSAPSHHAERLPTGRSNTVSYPYGSYSGYGNAPVQVAQAPAAIPAPPPVVATPAPKPACPTCGVVEAIVESEKPGEASGVGMAGGALGGAVIGRQFGRGTGQDVLTVLGAIGGAVAGHQVEKQVRTTRVYEVRVRMEDGSTRSVTQTSLPSWRAGDQVRIEGGAISAAGNV